ncbi:hypothetical protein SNE26_25265 [Mucilaginibacter sp. cycad4]|uniref:hypothetical protein n=1 Tax=Mucilaginibacter sp. cycad4 TaxID=3342096 RepID=UPI002AAB1005|nr:hypothetical protein [Mucilaginibacter gossypii]WPU99327.1 hypothetical protein SNE26_25265 [Mucilaginibacter gossypii]
MSQKTENIKLAYTDLDYAERLEIQQWIKDYEASDFKQRDSIRETFNKSLGPRATASCKYCGK